MRRRFIVVVLAAVGCGLVNTVPCEAAFSGSEVFLPSVGKGPGAAGSRWTTTMWIHNPGTDPANLQIMLLLRGQANPSPDVYYETVEPGETVRYEDAVDALFGGPAFGALRIVSDRRVVVASRIYSLQPGEDEEDSVGQFFAAVPAGFAIGGGQSTSLLGVFQTTPTEDSEYRYNFGFVETTGQPVTVETIALDCDGSEIGSKVYSLAGFEPMQANVADLLAGVDTDNARIEIIVVGGAGRVIAFGSGLANASSDPSTFEMAFADDLLGGGSSSAVVTDQTLDGDGTPGSPLGISEGGVGNPHLAPDSVGSGKIVDGTVGPQDLADGAVRKAKIAASGGILGDVLTWNGSNLVWAAPLQLPLYVQQTDTSGDPGFRIQWFGNGAAIVGESGSYGVEGVSWSSVLAGVRGWNSGGGPGVSGSAESGPGVRASHPYTGNWVNLADDFLAVDAHCETHEPGVRSFSRFGDGVSGQSDAAAKSGIYGFNTGGGYAAYFHGNVTVTGTLSKAGGSFRIDHPLDPENRYLQHSFVESPDMMNVYNGNVVLDGNGEAWVELPEWFETLNRDFRYQLTCIGFFAPVYVAHGVSGNRFRIAGGEPGLEVSWQVTGIRHDPWAEAHRIEVEPEKPERERGFYIHPELYGRDDDRGVTWIDRRRHDEREE